MRRMLAVDLPSTSEPIADLLRRRHNTFKRHHRRAVAERWLPLRVPEHGRPFGVVWFGDPHLDDDGCNWPLLERHIKVAKRTNGLYGACIGDTRNNWVGRLVRLYADQEATHREGHELAAWFLRDCGVPWLISVLGNHDMWNEGEAVAGMIHPRCTYVAAWEARVELKAGKQSWRVHAAHDFPGTSIYNKTHGPARKAIFSGGAAELYVAGHRHTFATQCFECDETGTVAHAVRCRGYKWHDRHAVVNGYHQGEAGASVLTIFNPNSTTPGGRILVFPDVEAGAEVLAAMRRKKR